MFFDDFEDFEKYIVYIKNYNHTNSIIECRTISSSSIAKLLSRELPNGSKERQVFGKKFEEGYQEFCWRWQDLINERVDWKNKQIINDGKCPDCKKEILILDGDDNDDLVRCDGCLRYWHDSCDIPFLIEDRKEKYYHALCQDCTSNFLVRKFKELMNEDEATEIMKQFVKNGIYGETPRTQFRHWKDDIYVACKPDLWNYREGYIEFKTYPIGEYSINQCKVFAWVLKEPVILVAWNGDGIEKEIVGVEELNFPEIPQNCISNSTIYEDRILL